MVWEILLGIILAIGILTTIYELRTKKLVKKTTPQNESDQDSKVV
jgi:hypothetical protein